MNHWPSVSIFVLNWNGQAYLDACLTALYDLDYPHFSVTLIDNASSDDSVALARERFPATALLLNARNLGYAGGNNVGLRSLTDDVAVLVNPDVRVERTWLQALIAPMVADQSVGVTGSKLFYPGAGALQHAGGFITQPQALSGHYGMGEQDAGQFDEQRDVDYVIGAAIAIRRDVIERIGDFDTGFFLYYEDVDYCRRARAAGFRVVFAPAARALHDESALTAKASLPYLRHMHYGRWRYLLKHTAWPEILDRTVPAERSWLAVRSSRERIALTSAYRTVLRAIPELYIYRRQEGVAGQAPAPAVCGALVAAIAGLAAETAKVHFDHLSQRQQQLLDAASTLAASAEVRAGPFSSRVPLLGPAIARLRSWWNSIEAEAYVAPILVQQNEANHLMWVALEEMRQTYVELGQQLQATHAKLQTHTLAVDQLWETEGRVALRMHNTARRLPQKSAVDPGQSSEAQP